IDISGQDDAIYNVTVSGIEGADTSEYSYRVTLIEPEMPQNALNNKSDEEMPLQITAYPNPFNSEIQIKINFLSATAGISPLKNYSLGIYNIKGFRVGGPGRSFAKKNDEDTYIWDASNYPAGIYLIQIRNKDLDASKRITLLK
ncbi:MAG: T9SS type A sorting domain-containing protein, partial [Fibrobacterota bacterium]